MTLYFHKVQMDEMRWEGGGKGKIVIFGRINIRIEKR